MAAASLDSRVRIWDVGAAKDIRTCDRGWYHLLCLRQPKTVLNHTKGPLEMWGCAYDPTSDSFASGSQGGSVSIWRVGGDSDEQEGKCEAARKAFVMSVRYSPDGKVLAAGLMDGAVVTYDVATVFMLLRS